MIGLYLLLPTLLVIIISFLVIRAGTIALMMTGMERKKASFQALSAFTRAGFTTREAEAVVNNPQRRRIITWLIILGNAGLVAVIVSATSSIVSSEGYQVPITIFAIIVGTYLIYKLISRAGFTRRWEGFIEQRFIKSHAFEDVATEDLLHFIEGYGLVRAITTKKLIPNIYSPHCPGQGAPVPVEADAQKCLKGVNGLGCTAKRGPFYSGQGQIVSP